MGMTMINGEPYGGSAESSAHIKYDNTNSALDSKNVQDALDELALSGASYKVISDDRFNPDLFYAAGRFVIHNNTLFKFIADKKLGPWDPSVVKATSITAELSRIGRTLIWTGSVGTGGTITIDTSLENYTDIGIWLGNSSTIGGGVHASYHTVPVELLKNGLTMSHSTYGILVCHYDNIYTYMKWVNEHTLTLSGNSYVHRLYGIIM